MYISEVAIISYSNNYTLPFLIKQTTSIVLFFCNQKIYNNL